METTTAPDRWSRAFPGGFPGHHPGDDRIPVLWALPTAC